MKGKICAFFGHRMVDANLSDALNKSIRKAIEEYDIKVFWCGNKGGFDHIAASATFQFKQEFPNIEIVYVRAYLPTTQEELPKYYTTSIFPEGLENVPKRFAISRRNQWMATNCDMVIAYINHSYGGAFKAYSIARNKGKILLNLGKWME